MDIYSKNRFEQELIQRVLLENGVIRPEHIHNAIEVQKKQVRENQKDLNLKSYYLNQEKYSLLITNPITDELLKEVVFPIKKKQAPRFFSADWYPVGGNNVIVFSDNECKEIGEFSWEQNDEIGITIGDNFSYLQIPNIEKNYYFPTINNLAYGYVPSEPINSLPLDMVHSNTKNLYFIDRGSGILYLFDLLENKLSGMVHLRPAGYSKKALNVASTPDGKKIFVTDNETPSLFIIDSKSLKIKKQGLPYGVLSNIYADQQWLYILVNTKGSYPQLVVVDNQNSILKETIELRGELFSTIDDPNDLIAISPSGKFLLVMTYVNYPSLFTPMVNVIDMENYTLADQIFLNDKTKPTYISFAMPKPKEFANTTSSLLEIMLEQGYISENEINKAIEKIEETEKQKALDVIPPEPPTTYKEENDFELRLIDDTEENDEGISSPEDYPVLSEYELDPSLLLAFKEEQMKHFGFLPINKINDILTIAVARDEYKEPLAQIIKQKFPELEVELVDFTLDEFNRFMKEFYSVIKDKFNAIVSNQLEIQAQQQKYEEEKKKTEEKKQEYQEQQLIKKSENNIIKPPPPRPMELPKTQMPPNLSAQIPSDVRLAVREKLKSLDPNMLDEAIIAICAEDFYNIWGMEVPKDELLKHSQIIKKARLEILEKDYAFIKIENLVGQFSLEIVVNQEKIVVMLKTLVEIMQTQGSMPSGRPKTTTIQQTGTGEVEKPKEIQKTKCIKCGLEIPAEIDICSKCSRESDYRTHESDSLIRSPSSPDIFENLEEGHLLFADIVGNRVFEINKAGQVIWQLGGKNKDFEVLYPSSSVRLRSKTTLIADSENDKIVEYTKSGRVYWELKNREGFRDLYLRKPVFAMRLINGNTLIVDQGNHRVFELNHLDKIVWQYGTTGTVGITISKLYSPSYVQRFSNGHTLITDTDNHRIIEIDENDEVIWQYGNPKNRLGSGEGSGRNHLNSPMFAYRLDNSNILIVDTGNSRILEVTTDKKVVWHFSTSIEDGSPINVIPQKAYRLKTGNTLIITNEQIIEVSPEGQLMSIKQIDYLPKSPSFDSEVYPDQDKILQEKFSKMSEVSEKARLASDSYVKNMSNLTELEVPLIDRSNHKVFVVNRFKNVAWRFGEAEEHSDNYLDRPQYAELIKDEYVLIADTDNHRVIKVYRPTKEIIWQYGITGAMGSGYNQLGHPRSVSLTQNNTLLITDQYTSRVIEVNMEKEVLWTFGGWDNSGNNVLNAPYYAQRTDTGTTLITDWTNHIVLEVNVYGDIVWMYGTPKAPGKNPNQLMYPEKAIRLSNGNTLICDTRNNRIIELTASKQITWEFFNYKIGSSKRQLSGPSDIFRLDNGNTVIIHNSNKNIIEINKNSEFVWQYQLSTEKKI